MSADDEAGGRWYENAAARREAYLGRDYQEYERLHDARASAQPYRRPDPVAHTYEEAPSTDTRYFGVGLYGDSLCLWCGGRPGRRHRECQHKLRQWRFDVAAAKRAYAESDNPTPPNPSGRL